VLFVHYYTCTCITYTIVYTQIDNSVATRHARRIYVGAIPPQATETEIQNFFNDIVPRLLAPQRTNGPPCLKVYINIEKCYAFAEFSSIELATACMQLDGIRYDHYTGVTILRIRRPNDYRPETLGPSGPIPEFNSQVMQELGISQGPGSDKVFVGGLPYNLRDDQIIELLSAFGRLKSFHQARDPATNMSKGYAFCEYDRKEVADAAIAGLNGMQIGDKIITVRYANIPSSAGGASSMMPMQSNMAMNFPGGNMNMLGNAGMYNAGASAPMNMTMGLPVTNMGGYNPPFDPMSIANLPPTRVLKLCNMLTHDDLYNESEYQDIKEDVRLECMDYGSVRDLIIPRVRDGYPSAAEGYIFVEYNDVNSARNAALALHNRKFADKVVIVQYVSHYSIHIYIKNTISFLTSMFMFLCYSSMMRASLQRVCWVS
jgi:splicing factor U2AF 65 kDa subunit